MNIFNTFLLIFFSLPFTFCNTQKEIPRVPDWAKTAVWYQIFPERFNNGDKGNDPKPEDMIGAWPYEVPQNWKPHPWTSDWYKLQPWEENGEGFYWNAQVRRYGGDLQGVIDKLDYLQDLGITAIYFNPVFESPSLHKYDATYYHHIDNNFGPNPKEDISIWNNEEPGDPSTWKWTTADKLFLDLIRKAHERNIKIIIDGVFNHTGRTFWAFKDIIKNQEKSKFTNWYTIKAFDNPETKKNEFDYEGWYGAMDLPEIKEDENGLIEDASKHIHAVVNRWMDPNNDGDPSDGIDGWRLDVAEMVKHNFWKKFRSWVKEINPEAYITGEIWWDDWSTNKMMNASPWLQGDQFDAVMNYRFTRAVKHFVSDKKNQISANAFIDTINNIRRDYNKENLYVLMNLLGSHDTERLASLIVNPDHWYDHNANPAQRESFDIRKPTKLERKKQKLMVGIQMTMPGAPMIYYGDEVGMWGGDDPDCRKPMVWNEYNYEVEKTHPFGKARPEDSVKVDRQLFDWYKKLVSIRKENLELSQGNLEFLDLKNKNVLGFTRSLNGITTTIIINNSNDEVKIKLNTIKNNSQNLLSNNQLLLEKSMINLQPYELIMFK